MRVTRSAVNKVMEEVFGQDILPVTKILHKNDEISEIKLAENLDVDVNEARRALYMLYNENLVRFKKKKDTDHGWYTYYWSFNEKSVSEMLEKTMSSRLNMLNRRLLAEKQTHYYGCCVRMTMENAMLYNFKCPECGDIMQPEDNRKRISTLKSSIKDVKEFLGQYS